MEALCMESDFELVGSQPSNALMVRNVSVLCDQKQLSTLFSQFGKIDECDFVYRGIPCKSFAFVEFSSTDEAKQAKVHFDSIDCDEILGRRLRVTFGGSEKHRVLKPLTVEVFCSFKSKSTEKQLYEETVKVLVETLLTTGSADTTATHDDDGPVVAKVVDVALKEYTIDKGGKGYSGIGIIHFPRTTQGVAMVRSLIEHVRQVTVDGIHYDFREAKMSFPALMRHRPDLAAVSATDKPQTMSDVDVSAISLPYAGENGIPYFNASHSTPLLGAQQYFDLDRQSGHCESRSPTETSYLPYDELQHSLHQPEQGGVFPLAPPMYIPAGDPVMHYHSQQHEMLYVSSASTSPVRGFHYPQQQQMQQSYSPLPAHAAGPFGGHYHWQQHHLQQWSLTPPVHGWLPHNYWHSCTCALNRNIYAPPPEYSPNSLYGWNPCQSPAELSHSVLHAPGSPNHHHYQCATDVLHHGMQQLPEQSTPGGVSFGAHFMNTGNWQTADASSTGPNQRWWSHQHSHHQHRQALYPQSYRQQHQQQEQQVFFNSPHYRDPRIKAASGGTSSRTRTEEEEEELVVGDGDGNGGGSTAPPVAPLIPGGDGQQHDNKL